MRITKWGEYSILFCIYLAGRNDEQSPAGATEIGKNYNIPTQYAQQILHRLRKGNIVRSIRGPHGGFKLVKSPEEIDLKEILVAAEGTTFDIVCENSPEPEVCSEVGSSCCLKYVWQDVRKAVDHVLVSTKLADLVVKHERASKGKARELVRISPAT